jgi:hypothetical protein
MTKLATLLVALNDKDFANAEALINADPGLLRQRVAKLTPLDLFCRDSNAAVVEWLCKKLTSLQMSVDIYDDSYSAPIHNSYSNSNVEIVKILAKYSEVSNLRNWLVQRQLVCILGANFLRQQNILLDTQQSKTAEGGFVIESAHVMCSAISHLMATSNRYYQIEESILNYYDNTCLKGQQSILLEKLLDRVNQKDKPRVIFNSGFASHTFTVSIKQQQDSDYQLSFYDTNCPDEGFNLINNVRAWVTGEIAVIRRINVPADKLAEVVLKLISVKNKPEAEVYGYINSLPNMLNTSFTYEQNILVNTNYQEDNRCYWENPKYAVMDLFIDEFGVELGTQEFDKFLKSINLKTIENFKKTFTNQYDQQAIHHLEKMVVATSSVKTPAAFALRAIFSLVTTLTAIVVTVCCGYAALGIPGFTALATLLGPVGLVATAVVATTLIFHELTLRFMAKMLFSTSAIISNKNTPLLKKTDQNKKEVELPLPASQPVNTLQQPLLEDSASSTRVMNSGAKSFMFGFFKKSAPPTAPAKQLQTPHDHRFKFAGKPTQSLTIQQDLNDLWTLPMTSLLSRLQN